MFNKTPKNKFPIINKLTKELLLLNGDLQLTTKDNSICIGRIQLDKSTQKKTLMTSCIKEAFFLYRTFYIFLIEQHNENNSLEKFSFKLTDSEKNSLKQYDKDSKRGSHIHNFINGKKVNKHIPFSGSIKDIAKDIFETIGNDNKL